MLTDDDRAALEAMAERNPDDPDLAAALNAASASDKSRALVERIRRVTERTGIK